MEDVGIFIYGIVVFGLVALALGLLVWGIVEDHRSRHSSASPDSGQPRGRGVDGGDPPPEERL
jgi:hypothetical protein